MRAMAQARAVDFCGALRRMSIPYAKLSNALLATSVILYVVCLANDGYTIEGANPRAWSAAWGLLLLGWLALGTGVLAWLANPVLFMGWILLRYKRFKSAAACAAIALLLMISFLFVDKVISSEAGTYSTITGYGLGYWLWLASSAALLIGSILSAIRQSVRI